MYHCGMRQVEEKHVANQIDLMVWSKRLDLLAISNFKGEVQVHRLRWQKVWTLPPPKEDVSVVAMAWRPDGKALAVGYSSASIYIVDIEDKEILDKYDLPELDIKEDFDLEMKYDITCITWALRVGTLESSTEYNFYDDTSIFLQKLPSLSTGFKSQASDDNTKDFKEIQEPNQLNMLIVGFGTGYLYLSIFGRYPYGTLNLPKVVDDNYGEYTIKDICLSDDFRVMQVFYTDKLTHDIHVALINTCMLSAYAEEMFIVASRHGQVVQLLSYLDQTLISITESWEHILLEMDTKMAYCAASLSEGGFSADFLELLMFGVPSDELELFLLQELTAKGLKKFGSSVELSYSTIQRLVLNQLNIVGQSLTYYLSEVRGLTRIPDRYKIFSLDEATVTEAIKAACAFMNKCLELQQVIDVSMRNYKAFFRWLFVVIVRLLDEQIPTEIVKVTQQDLAHIAEFLYNFDNVQVESNESTSDKPAKFNLERLGQYLQDQDLTILPDNEDNTWHKFLRDNSCFLKDSETVFSMIEFRKFSLVQQQKYLKNAVHKVFDVTGKDIGKHVSALCDIRCHADKTLRNVDNLRVSQMFDASQQRFMVAFVVSAKANDGFFFMTIDIKEKDCSGTAIKYYFSPTLIPETNNENTVMVSDLQFYSPVYLSVITTHPTNEDSSIFIQFPLTIAKDNAMEFDVNSRSILFTEKVSREISPLLDQGVLKVLETMDGYKIAVCGRSKVAVVLSKSRRKVRVFELEVDGEETLNITPQSNVTHGSDDIGTSDTPNITTDNITL